MKVNIIGDIHGRYHAMLELLQKMPKADKTISIGDLIDKGNMSIEVVEYFMKMKNTEVLLGNHEVLHLATLKRKHKDLDKLKLIKRNDFRELYLKSETNLKTQLKEIQRWSDREAISNKFADYFEKMNLEVEIDNLYISHAPFTYRVNEMKNFEHNFSKMFNNNPPVKIEDKACVFGHTQRPRMWKTGTSGKLEINKIDKVKGKLEKGQAIGIDGGARYLIGMSVDSVTLEYELFFVDGSKEWNSKLGKKYCFNAKRREVLEKQLSDWENSKK